MRRLLSVLAVCSLASAVAPVAQAAVEPAPPAAAPTAADPDPTPPGDACRERGGPGTLCAGLDQLGNAATAWCREYLTCTQPDPGAMSDWVVDALADQRALGDPLPLIESFWFGTHNSYNSPTYGFSLSRNDMNQRYSITDQLDMGARFLELDVHWFLERPVVCHARPAEEGHAGCSTEQTVDAFVDEIAAWLGDHPDEVIALRIEDHLQDDENRAAVGELIRQRLDRDDRAPFGDLIYWPTDATPCADWPFDVSRDDLRAADAQVLLVTDECGDEGHGDGLGAGAWYYEKDEGGPTEACSFPTFIRAFEDATWLGTASGGGERFTPDEVATMLPCVNQLDLDMLDPHDERLPALVWSWALEEPSGPGCVVDDGRFRTEDCAAKHRFACQAADGSWSLTDARGSWDMGSRLCDIQTDGTFDVPRTAREHAALRAVASGTVWVHYHDRDADGTWSAP